SCGEDKKNTSAEGTEEHAQHESEMGAGDATGNLDDGEPTGNPEFQNELLAAVYEDYNQLRSHLVNSDAAESQKAGEELAQAIQQAEAGEAALGAAQKIASTSDLKEQRIAFSDLSAAVESMIEGNLSSGEVYKQYCPMAFDGEGGYWLSSSKEVRNPYYGDMMLKCGRVDETIK